MWFHSRLKIYQDFSWFSSSILPSKYIWNLNGFITTSITISLTGTWSSLAYTSLFIASPLLIPKSQFPTQQPEWAFPKSKWAQPPMPIPFQSLPITTRLKPNLFTWINIYTLINSHSPSHLPCFSHTLVSRTCQADSCHRAFLRLSD